MLNRPAGSTVPSTGSGRSDVETDAGSPSETSSSMSSTTPLASRRPLPHTSAAPPRGPLSLVTVQTDARMDFMVPFVREDALREQLNAADIEGDTRALSSLDAGQLQQTLKQALSDDTVERMAPAAREQLVLQVLNKMASHSSADAEMIMRTLLSSPLLSKQLRDADKKGLLQRPLDEYLDAALLRPRDKVPGVAEDGELELGKKYGGYKGAAKFVSELKIGLFATLLGNKPAYFLYNNSAELLRHVADGRSLNPKFALVMNEEEALLFNKPQTTAIIESHPHLFGLPQSPSPTATDDVFAKLVTDLSKPGAIEEMWDDDEVKLGVLLGYGESNARKYMEQGDAQEAEDHSRLAALGPQEMQKALFELNARSDQSLVRPFQMIVWDGDETRAILQQSKQDVVAINEQVESLHAEALKSHPDTFKADVMIDLALDTLYAPK